MGELVDFPKRPIPDIKPRTGIDPIEGRVSDTIPPESLLDKAVDKAMGFARRALGKINTQKPRNTPF